MTHSPHTRSASGRRRGPATAIALLTLAWLGPWCTQHLCAQDRWPSFRNDGRGTITVERLPTEWDAEHNIAWRARIRGYGQSAPVVWGDLAFLTSCDGPWQENGYVQAFALETGEQRWTTKVPATTKVENYFRNSRAAPTCVVDEDLVVSFFPGGDVTAMDHAGNTVWSVPLFANVGVENERATASSLAQTAALVYALVDHHGPSLLVALRKGDGSVAWRVDRGPRMPSWSSPVVASHGDRELVVTSSSHAVEAYDAATGELLWRAEGFYGNQIASACVAGDSIYVGATHPMHSKGPGGNAAASNARIQLRQQDGQPSYSILWRAKRARASFATPLAFAGYVYYVNRAGVLYCLDAETGEELFRKRLGEACWASPIGVTVAGRRLAYFVMKSGETLILEPADTFKAVARNPLWDEEQMLAAAESARRQRGASAVEPGEAPPREGPEKALRSMPEASVHRLFSYGDPVAYATAVVEGRLLVRTGQHLFCVAGTAESPQGDAVGRKRE
ncbi:MAG: PQQ-binding-like beta-propeller repeat protein [Planctomycetota bacterium]